MLHEHRFRALNTDVGVWLWAEAPEEEAPVRRSLLWAEGAFLRAEAELSRFRETSGLSRLNARAGDGPQPVSPLLWRSVTAAVAAAEESGGIFDPTLLRPLQQVGYDRSFEALAATGPGLPTVVRPVFGGWRQVSLDGQRQLVALPAGTGLDLGGIGKGWLVDFVASTLGASRPVLVDAGGDLRVVGTVPGEPWPIAVQDAFDPAEDRGVVRLEHGALATSSIGGRRWQRGDRTWHHVIDPRTGLPSASDLQAVTVSAPTALQADVTAKVVLILGSAAGASYLGQRNLSGLLTCIDGREIVVGNLRREGMDA